jgi:endonuclease/exonuclease/phosphatase family metal-dependent hydrolase
MILKAGVKRSIFSLAPGTTPVTRTFNATNMGNLLPGVRTQTSAESDLPANMITTVLDIEAISPANTTGNSHVQPVSVASWNVLAPCYRRLPVRNSIGRRLRESHAEHAWRDRAEDTLTFLRQRLLSSPLPSYSVSVGGVTPLSAPVPPASPPPGEGVGIIGLQEFWLDAAYRAPFDSAFSAAGYRTFTLKRTAEGKHDAVALLVRSDGFSVRARCDVQLLSDGDRVALLLHLVQRSTGLHVVVANTHLTFPHTPYDSEQQLREVRALLRATDRFCEQQGVPADSLRVVMGDFNVSQQSAACALLQQAGYSAAFLMEPPVNGQPCASAGCEGQAYMSRSRLLSRTSLLSSEGGSDLEGEREKEKEREREKEPEARPVDVPAPASAPSWVSHRTHRQEELGVDHVFLRVAAERQRLEVYDTSVLPEALPCAAWMDAFQLSDHRPVRATVAVVPLSVGA